MGENSITRYYIAEENLVGRVKERKSDYDLMAAVMICLGKEEDFHIRMTQALEREVSFMCNLSKGVEEKGIEKGRQEGIIAMVSALKDLKIADSIILNKIQEKFQLEEEKARMYL